MYGSSALLEGNTAFGLRCRSHGDGHKGSQAPPECLLEWPRLEEFRSRALRKQGLLAQGNTLSGFSSGLVLDGAKSCAVEGNTVLGNARGIVVEGASPGTIVASNVFEDNAQSVAGAGKRRASDGPRARGNYWDDYKGYDLDGDGIGDAPYRRSRGFSTLVVKEPLLGVFFGSPLQRAVDGLDPDAQILDTRPLIRH